VADLSRKPHPEPSRSDPIQSDPSRTELSVQVKTFLSIVLSCLASCLFGFRLLLAPTSTGTGTVQCTRSGTSSAVSRSCAGFAWRRDGLSSVVTLTSGVPRLTCLLYLLYYVNSRSVRTFIWLEGRTESQPTWVLCPCSMGRVGLRA